MTHPKILDKGTAALVVVDIQEAFRNAIPDFAVVASRASMAVRGFQILGVPVLVTEQYPKGLGPTAEEIKVVLEEGTPVVEKTAFSSCGANEFAAHLERLKPRQVYIWYGLSWLMQMVITHIHRCFPLFQIAKKRHSLFIPIR